MLETPALWVAFGLMTPLMLFTAWNDFVHLRIPNWIPIAVVVIYCVTGLWGLPIDAFLRGLAAGAVVLVVFFLFYVLVHRLGGGGLGGGDVKLMAALVPFIALKDAFHLLVVFAVLALSMSICFMIFRAFRRAPSQISSLNQGETKVLKVVSPFGISMGATVIYYLAIQVAPTL